jgi:hypothetical protein
MIPLNLVEFNLMIIVVWVVVLFGWRETLDIGRSSLPVFSDVIFKHRPRIKSEVQTARAHDPLAVLQCGGVEHRPGDFSHPRP